MFKCGWCGSWRQKSRELSRGFRARCLAPNCNQRHEARARAAEAQAAIEKLNRKLSQIKSKVRKEIKKWQDQSASTSTVVNSTRYRRASPAGSGSGTHKSGSSASKTRSGRSKPSSGKRRKPGRQKESARQQRRKGKVLFKSYLGQSGD